MLDFDSTKCVLEHKNHSAQNMEHIATFRGLNAEAKSQIAGYVHDPAMWNRFIAQTTREQFPELAFTSGVVKNARAYAKQTDFGGYTPTQAMFRDLDEREGVAYTVKWMGGDPNSQKLEGLEHCTRVTDANLLTVTTDADTAMMNALRTLFPDTHLQPIKFHLNKNVALNISHKWDAKKVPPGSPSQESGQAERSNGYKNSGSENITAEENRRVVRLNDVVRSIEKGDQSPPLFLGVDQVEFSKAGIWSQWEIVSTHDTASEFQAEWDKMLVLFATQAEIVKYFNRQIKPTIREWRKVAWKAMRLVNLQLLKLERHRRGEAVEFDKTSITQGMGIVSAKDLLARHGKERVVFQLEDVSPFWWLERSDDDTDRYLSLLDPDKVLILKGRPRIDGRFKSDPKTPLVHTQRLPPSTAPSALTGIRPSARRVALAWETQDVDDLTSSVAAAPASSL
ncbi:hypothetical protein PsorP6_005742 [Peronosclerospora sorghi]|uniref:Uncharacterized protein n=1 Tax=Peronosclerospora sorghi TaxID=230839 RepID=A0ACC0W4W9_9STRA|nr:hypothetical protein PsorP6_005742 [Peronosclerospora sorghi]